MLGRNSEDSWIDFTGTERTADLTFTKIEDDPLIDNSLFGSLRIYKSDNKQAEFYKDGE